MNDLNALLIKIVRYDKHRSNQDRIKEVNHDSDRILKKIKAYEAHELCLRFLMPFLELLPDPKLHHPIKKLASVILTIVITQKRRKDSLLLKTDAPKISSSACYKFKLSPSDVVKNRI